MRILLRAALAVAVVASATPVKADNVQVGVLDCRGASQQFIVGSVTNLQCLFRPSNGARPEAYAAQIRRVGLDVGVNQSTSLGWSVFAPTRVPVRGSLAGNYIGASANATVGVGIGANALVGGSNNTIALQPLSGQAQTGLGVAGGISSMDLVSARPAPVRRKRHHRR